MAEPASRIESATSYREPDGNKPSIDSKEKEKPRFKVKAAGASRERAEHDDPGDSERHQLDTLA